MVPQKALQHTPLLQKFHGAADGIPQLAWSALRGDLFESHLEGDRHTWPMGQKNGMQGFFEFDEQVFPQ